MRVFRFFGVIAYCGSILGILPNFAQADSFVGYTGADGDKPTVGGVAFTTTAADARTAFLNNLSYYYYEDFQEVQNYEFGNPNNLKTYDGKSFSTIGISSYPFVYNLVGTPESPAPTSTITPSSTSDLKFELGPTANARGDFGLYDPSLVAAVPGQALLTANNWYLDVTGSNTETITFSPNQFDVGLELNDVIQPSKDTVTINFYDGSLSVYSPPFYSPVLGANKANNSPGGTLSNNNVWFIGVEGITPISSVVINYGGDPITIDNIYVSADIVPLPNTAASTLVLLGMVGSYSYWRSKKRYNHPII